MTELDRRTFLTQAAGGVASMAIVPELFGRSWSSAPVRVGVIGAGRQGRAALGELGKLGGAKIVAVCDVDERRLGSGLRRVQGAEGFASIDAMLTGAAKPDAVVIATPTHTHRTVAERVLSAGLDVYCEAPLSHTIEDAVAIARAARESGRVVGAGLEARANPVYQLARTFFRSDSVRDPVSMRAQEHKKTNWISPSRDAARYEALNWKLDPARANGLAGEWGTHQFDVFGWYLGRYPSKAVGHGSIRLHDDGRTVADTVGLSLIYEDGMQLQYDATLANSYGGRHEVLHGTNAAVKLAWSHGWMFKEADAPTQGWEVYANRQQFHNDEGITLIAGATKLAEQGKLKDGIGLPNTSLYYALEDWLIAVRDRTTPATSIEEGVRATAVGIAGNRAVVEGGMIDIELPEI